MRRRLVIGDIHGGLLALKQVLIRCKYSSLKDQLIFLGDYSDGWSETSQTVSFLIKLDKLAKYKPIFLMGNHDIWVKDWFNIGIKNVVWLGNGGKATVESYMKTGLIIDKEHKKFYNNLKNWYVDGDKNLFVHAGWDYTQYDFINGATIPMGKGAGINGMECHWNRSLIDSAMTLRSMPNAKFDKLKEFKEIFIGHSTTEKWLIKPNYPEYKLEGQPKNGRILVPINAFNIWNLDTGGGWSGKLTVMDIDSKQFWQSDFVYDLYPEETGRNYKVKYKNKKPK